MPAERIRRSEHQWHSKKVLDSCDDNFPLCKMNEAITIHSFAVNKIRTLVDGSEGGDSCGNARNVRHNKPRASEGCGLHVCPRNASAVANINDIAKKC